MAEGQKDVLVWKDDAGEIHAVEIDIVTDHDDERSVEVTSHPVEKGADINDHVISQPDKLTIEIAQTQTPFPSPVSPEQPWKSPKGFSQRTVTLDVRKSQFQPGGLLALTEAVKGAVSAVTGAIGSAIGLGGPGASDETKVSVFQADEPRDRIGELHDQLISILDNRRFCTVTFRGRIYPDFLMTKVGWKSAKGEPGLGRFSCELRSIRIVETAVADLPDPASLRLKPAKKQAKLPKPADPAASGAKKEPLESMLSKGTGAGVSSG